MAKFKVVHDFWGQREHKFFCKGQTIDVEDDRADELLATHPTVGTPLIKAATKRTTNKKEEVTSDDAVSDDK